MIDVSKATAIQGWMTEPELTWLAEQASKHSVIVEVGSFLGRSTRAMADNSTGVIYAIDDFYGPRDVIIPDEERPKIFDAFVQNMDGVKAKVTSITADHAAFPNPAVGKFQAVPDMVFIDGDHQYASVKRDIKYWNEQLSENGLICGHDIYFKEVYLAVYEKFPSAKIAPNTTIWYVQK